MSALACASSSESRKQPGVRERRKERTRTAKPSTVWVAVVDTVEQFDSSTSAETSAAAQSVRCVGAVQYSFRSTHQNISLQDSPNTIIHHEDHLRVVPTDRVLLAPPAGSWRLWKDARDGAPSTQQQEELGPPAPPLVQHGHGGSRS